MQMKNTAPLINTHSAGMNRKLPQRWIESLNGERATNPIKDFPLPKGEGQGEGKPRSMPKRRVFCHRDCIR